MSEGEHTISGLIRKRAELAGEIEALHKQISQKIADLSNVDATILLFDPGCEIEGIKPKAFRPPDDWSKRGEMAKAVLGVLRRAPEPMTCRDIAFQIMVERGLDGSDVRLLNLMRQRVATALRHQRNMGNAESKHGAGHYNVWSLVKREERKTDI